MTGKSETLFHPVRMRIVLALAGHAMTAQQLLAELDDVPQATLYRHLNALAASGLLTIVEERPAHSNVEKVYTLVDGAAMLSAEELATATVADHLRYFNVFLGMLLHRFSAYLEQPAFDLERDGVGYRTLPLNLNEAELVELVTALNQALRPYLDLPATPDRRRRWFSTVLIPE